MQFKHSIGNKKIGKDTLIFNMGSATNCAAKKKGLCDIDCYAKKAEVQYPAVLPAREHQEQYWLTMPVNTIVADIAKVVKSKRHPLKYVRVNESGDLHSEACLHKLIMIAEALPNLKFYTYTHRSDLIDNDTFNFIPSNLVVNTSNFKREGLNQFKAVKVETKFRSYQGKSKEIKTELKTISNSNFNCGGDCSKCSLCKVSHGKDIYVAYH